MSGENHDSATVDRSQAYLWLVLGLFGLALVLRFWKLGVWNFQATEIFTLRDSNTPQFHNPRPLGYLLTYYLVRPFHSLDEFGLRLLPAIFGALTIPAVYLVNRRLVGSRAALLAALLMVGSPLLVMYSQLARYWSLVCLLSAVYPAALYLGVRDRDRSMLALGIVTALLAVLAHPVSSLLMGGPLLLLLAQLRPANIRRLWDQPAGRWGLIIAGVVGVVLLIRLLPILESWFTEHKRNPGMSQFLLRPVPPGLKQIFLVLAYVESLTVPLFVFGALGLYLLWREGNRILALLLISMVIFPLVFLALVTLRAPVSQYYLLPTVPVWFIAAGVFVDRLFQNYQSVRPRWLLPAAVIAVIVAAGLPTLLSDYRDGRRFDFRGAARWLAPRLQATDVVFSDQFMVLGHYLPRAMVQRLRSPEPLEETVEALREAGQGGVLWIVAPAASHAFRADLKRGGLIGWMYDHCQLRQMLGVGRMDLRQDYLQIYQCPPAPARAETGALPAKFSPFRANSSR
jgi:4-amino-4-deoxy-L-arabinose transferase-like glycosyltransferase